MTYDEALSLCHSMICYYESHIGLEANRVVVGVKLYEKLRSQTRLTVHFCENGIGETFRETLFGIPITIDHGRGRENVFEVYHAEPCTIEIDEQKEPQKANIPVFISAGAPDYIPPCGGIGGNGKLV